MKVVNIDFYNKTFTTRLFGGKYYGRRSLERRRGKIHN